MLVGYARVSTLDQSLELQVDFLKKTGCEKIYEDCISGTITNRPGLQLALEVLRENDVFVVWKLDRLGRSVKGLIDLVTILHKKGVHFKSITDNVDTSTPSGRFFFHIILENVYGLIRLLCYLNASERCFPIDFFSRSSSRSICLALFVCSLVTIAALPNLIL